MTRASLAAAVVVFLLLGVMPAAAQYYTHAPWCAVVSTGAGDVHWDCIYRSIEECRPNVLAGNRGFCNPNPYFVPSAGAAGKAAQTRASAVGAG
jgi:hypothetical protein